MESWRLGVLAGDLEAEAVMALQMNRWVASVLPYDVVPRAQIKKGERWLALLARSSLKDIRSAAESARDNGATAVFLVQNEFDGIPPELENGTVDDLVLLPLRPLDLLSKVAHVETLMKLEELTHVNSNLGSVVQKFQEDLKIIQKLHRAHAPKRFPPMKGFRVESKYLSGLKSGGDYFDVIEGKDQARVSVMLSDSSSFGLANAVMTSMLKVAAKAGVAGSAPSSDVVQSILEDVKLTLGDQDQLSLFFGMMSRKDWILKYTHLGTSQVFHSGDGSAFQSLPHSGPAISKGGVEIRENEAQLRPKDRLILLSDGFVDCAGGEKEVRKILNSKRQNDSKEVLEELVYRVKSKLPDPEDMPDQDCTAVIMDVDSKMIRLASG
jgi:serine phosphatase RsbU (regulator of sigma subunit)